MRNLLISKSILKILCFVLRSVIMKIRSIGLLRACLLISMGCLLFTCHQDNADEKSSRLKMPDFTDVGFTVTEVTGIGLEEGITRRDPSDVIKVGDMYYLWYTRVDRSKSPVHLGASGYAGTIWYATSKDEGRNWIEQGQALGTGSPGNFDSFGVFTPNILAANGKYYLYYTGVRPTLGNKDGHFENNSANDFTAIGLAVGDSPKGPFKRIQENPILSPTTPSDNPERKPSKFDSYRVDDAALVVRDGKYWLYYKGRNIDYGNQGPRHTQMGVAVAEKVEGPYVKQNISDSVQSEGHEVLVWAYGEGVVSLVTNVGRGFYYAKDGIHFVKVTSDFEGNINAPGAYRRDLTEHEFAEGIQWGISMNHGEFPYLLRWESTQLSR